MKHFLAALLFAAAVHGAAPSKDTDAVCREFLDHLPTVYFATSGTHVEFTGQFLAVPDPLQGELRQLFPEHTFRIAKMSFIHWGPEPVNLLLMVHDRSAQVVTYLWDLWFTSPPFSFRARFGHARTSKDASAQLGALARLIAHQTGWTAGEVRTSDGVITAPLIATHNNGNRALRLKLNPDFTEMAFDIVALSDQPEPTKKP